jgi:hypothetical protein
VRWSRIIVTLPCDRDGDQGWWLRMEGPNVTGLFASPSSPAVEFT